MIRKIIEYLGWLLQFHIKNRKERMILIECIKILCKKIDIEEDNQHLFGKENAKTLKEEVEKGNIK